MKQSRPADISRILVGLNIVGIVGLQDALRSVTEAGLNEREEVTDFVLELLASHNYVPDSAEYRQAVWREFLRYRGEDISPFYPEIEVTVRAGDGPERDRFVRMLTSVLNDMELRPLIAYVAAPEPDSPPELLIGDESVARGDMSVSRFRAAVRRRFSEW